MSELKISRMDQSTNGQLESKIKYLYRMILPLTAVTIIMYYMTYLLLERDVRDLNIQKLILKYVFQSVPDKPRWKWPPDNPYDIYDVKSGHYDLTLQPYINSGDINSDWIETYVMNLENRLKNHQFNGSKLKQLVQMDELVRLGSDQPNYKLYPQAIDVKDVIESIRQGKPIRQMPINNPELKILETPRRVCAPIAPNVRTNNKQPINYDIVVIIKSCVLCFEDRQAAREIYAKANAWNNMSVGVVFIIGLPSFSETRTSNIHGLSHNITVSVPKFDRKDPVRNRLLIAQKLAAESRLYGDLVIGSFLDTYFNSTLKQMTAMRWASCFCRNRAKLFFIIGLEEIVQPYNFKSFLRNVPKHMETVIAIGSLVQSQKVRRIDTSQKYDIWSVSEDEIPWRTYPAFVSGSGYILGSKVVEEISIASSFTRLFRLEDVFLGFVMQKIDRIFFTYEGFSNDKAKQSWMFN